MDIGVKSPRAERLESAAQRVRTSSPGREAGEVWIGQGVRGGKRAGVSVRREEVETLARIADLKGACC